MTLTTALPITSRLTKPGTAMLVSSMASQMNSSLAVFTLSPSVRPFVPVDAEDVTVLSRSCLTVSDGETLLSIVLVRDDDELSP